MPTPGPSLRLDYTMRVRHDLSGGLRIQARSGPKGRSEVIVQRRTISTAALVLMGALGASGAGSAQVKTTGGAVQGTPSANGAIRVFKGIPYAAPPVGE